MRTPVDRATAARIERAEGMTHVAWLTHTARAGRAVLDTEAAVVSGACCTAWPSMRHAPDWQRAYGLGAAADATGEQLEDVLAFYRRRGLGATIDICPYSVSLAKLCASRGLTPAWFTSVLVASPAAAAATTPVPAPAAGATTFAAPAPAAAPEGPGEEGWRVVTLQTGDPLTEAFSHSYVDAFEWDEKSREAAFYLAAASIGTPGMTCYALCQGDRVIGGGALFMHDGVANLHGAWVLPAFRGRGGQSLLIRRRLADATAAGCDIATVQTGVSTPSQRNLERLGFRLAYTRLVMHTDTP